MKHERIEKPCKITMAVMGHQKRADEAAHIAAVQRAYGADGGYWRENAHRHYKSARNAALLLPGVDPRDLPSDEDIERLHG